jgi:hypothetical protein
LAPLIVVGLAFLAEALGHEWNVHGDAGAVYALILITALGALVIESFAIPSAVRKLFREPKTRTLLNALCTGAASLFVVAAVGFGVFLFR